MSITYWLDFEDKDRCFPIRRRGTAFEHEPAYITAYEVCKGLNEYYSNGKKNIPLRDAKTGKRFHDLPLTATNERHKNVDKMIKWLRDKHDIFYSPAINLCIPLEDPLSMRVKRFWEAEDARQKQIEEYCKNDPACSLSLKKLHNQYVAHHEEPITPEVQRLKKERDELKESLEGGGYACSGCKRTTCGYFAEILSTLGVKNAVVYPARGQSKVECFAKLANERAQVIFKENQTLMQQVDAFSKITDEYKDKIESLKRVVYGLNVRVHNQSSIIKTQNESLTKQRKQLKDLGVALGNVKNTVDFEIDTLTSDHGDEIIPEF